VHFAAWILAQLLDLIQGTALGDLQTLLGAAIVAPGPSLADERDEFVVRGPLAEHGTHIDAVFTIQAQIPEAIGRQPAAVAILAKGLRRRCDDTDTNVTGQNK
jgi:hypothetical protein